MCSSDSALSASARLRAGRDARHRAITGGGVHALPWRCIVPRMTTAIWSGYSITAITFYIQAKQLRLRSTHRRIYEPSYIMLSFECRCVIIFFIPSPPKKRQTKKTFVCVCNVNLHKKVYILTFICGSVTQSKPVWGNTFSSRCTSIAALTSRLERVSAPPHTHTQKQQRESDISAAQSNYCTWVEKCTL